MKRTRTPATLRALGEMIAKLTPEEQSEFLGAVIAGHDRLANDIHRETRGQEDGRPVWHDKMARMLTEIRNHLAVYPQQ